MSSNLQTSVRRFCSDSDGKVVLWQRPNIPLAGWLVCKVISMLSLPGSIKTGLGQLSTAFLFTWAYLEIVSGKSYFRRALGGVIMAAVLIGYFW